jgi:hypothetical protein
MSPDEYRDHAASCRAVAELLPDGTSKRTLMEMAAAWQRLADNAERNLAADMVYKALVSHAPSPTPTQQQQQIQPQKDEE